MTNHLERIKIIGLHGNKNLDIQLKDNTLILVGENGSGKTTVLRILFNFLSGRWFALIQFRFERIIAIINGEEFSISREDLVNCEGRLDNNFFQDLPLNIQNKINYLIHTPEMTERRKNLELRHISERYDIPYNLIRNKLITLDDFQQGRNREIKVKIEAKIKKITEATNSQILYLPTYRRIEQELSNIFEGSDPDDFRRRRRNRIYSEENEESYIELVEFGMKDVENDIERLLMSLKEFARENLNELSLHYLGEVVNQDYEKVNMDEIANVTETTVNDVLNRIDERILNKTQKDHVLNVVNDARLKKDTNEHSKIISHYFLKLLRFQEAIQEKEKPISEFCNLCSDYITDKKFVYDSSTFSFSIIPKRNNLDLESRQKIQLSDLSSGEKQIVSLFSHLYLSDTKSFFVLIDEPELSLSVPWQRRFLTDIKNGEMCQVLIAVTHSPFIYDNELAKYAHSIGEFVNF